MAKKKAHAAPQQEIAGTQSDEIVRNASNGARLRQIAAELGYLYSLSDPHGPPSPLTRADSVLIREVIGLGAFAGDEWVKLRANSVGIAASESPWGDGFMAWVNATDILFDRTQDAAACGFRETHDFILAEIEAAADALDNDEAELDNNTPDESAWVPAAALWTERKEFEGSRKKLNKFREHHREMFRNPSRYKMEIHAGGGRPIGAAGTRPGFKASTEINRRLPMIRTCRTTL